MLEENLHGSVRVIGIADCGGYYDSGAVGIDPYFSARFTFSSVKVEWEAYKGWAWYERLK